ncbi:BatC protein [Oryzobacter terrae]|uniref:BatC protein n=1 Tax=Oryzobacter terrae TaxID=1620385 RepID=UPI003670C0AB
MSDLPMDDQLPDGDGKLGGAEGPADAGAGDTGLPGEHDGGADGGAGGGAGATDPEGPADSGAGDTATEGEHDGGADGGADAS